jgi:adenylate kinase
VWKRRTHDYTLRRLGGLNAVVNYSRLREDGKIASTICSMLGQGHLKIVQNDAEHMTRAISSLSMLISTLLLFIFG